MRFRIKSNFHLKDLKNMDTSHISVYKAVLTHGMFIKVWFEENLPGNVKINHPGWSKTTPVHDDLANAFKKLIPHMAFICEEITKEQFIDAIPNDDDATQPTEIYIPPAVIPVEFEMGEEVKAPKGKKGTKHNPIVIKGEGSDEQIKNLFGETEPEKKAIDSFSCYEIAIKNTGGTDSISLTGHKVLTSGKWMGIHSPMIKLQHDDYIYSEDLDLIKEEVVYEIREYIINGKQAPDRDPELPFPDGIGQEEKFDLDEESPI